MDDLNNLLASLLITFLFYSQLINFYFIQKCIQLY